MRSLLSTATVLALAASLVVPASLPAAAAAPAPAAAASSADESTYTPLTPVRVLDTREGAGLVGPGRTVAVDLASKVPTGTTAVVLNVTGVSPTAETYVTAYPSGEARPLASSLNLARGEIRANLVTVRVTDARAVTLYNHLGSTHLVADLAGYYSTGDGSRFTPTDYNRRLSLSMSAREAWEFDFSASVPESATAVMVNVTGVAPTAATFLTAWPTGAARPVASNMNLAAGKINPNLVIVPLGEGRRFSVYNNAGDITVHADLAGFYTPEYGAVFAPSSPARLFDTRTGVGTENGVAAPIRAGQTVGFQPGQKIPGKAVAAVMNLTGVSPTTGTFVSATVTGPDPGHSNLNLVAGQTSANLALVPLNWIPISVPVWFYNKNGSVNVVADLAGYFWVPPGDCVSECAYSWGANAYGELGTGGTTSSFTPAQLVGLSDVADVVDRYALRGDGTVWAWGDNGYGQLGNGWEGARSNVPVPVRNLTDVVAVASAATTGFALRADGTVWGWGSTSNDLLLTDDYQNRTSPVQLPVLDDVTAIASGQDTAYALRVDGTVWAWGDNTYGQLGNGTTEPSAIPVQVSGLSGVTAIGAGWYNGFAVMADGTVRTWGSHGDGTAGNGSADDKVLLPVTIPGATDVTMVVADLRHVHALRSDGTVLSWGDNFQGTLGIGVDCREWGSCVVRTPTAVSLTDVVDIAVSGQSGGYALDSAGQVWAWGGNYDGQLGRDENMYAVSPVVVPNLPPVDALGFSRSGGRVLVSAP